jgi:hypothetical protein
MDYKELVQNHSGELIEKLVTFVISKENFEILFNFEDDDQWSIISMHQYEEDLEISLRLHTGGIYDLYVGYYDDDDEFFELTHILTEDEIAIIPDGLKKVMKKVVEDERGMRLSGSFIGR